MDAVIIKREIRLFEDDDSPYEEFDIKTENDSGYRSRYRHAFQTIQSDLDLCSNGGSSLKEGRNISTGFQNVSVKKEPEEQKKSAVSVRLDNDVPSLSFGAIKKELCSTLTVKSETVESATHEPSSNQLFACPRCRLRFKSGASLKAHFFIHTDEKPHSSPFCQKKFKFVDVLNQHTSIMHPNRMLCVRCATRLKNVDEVNVHLKRPASGLAMSCTHCPATFKTPCDLMKHKNIEHEEKPFACSICPSAFKLPNHLALHKRSHCVEAPSTCPVCQATFKQLRHLKTHMHAHIRTNDRPFLCPICKAAFKRKSHQQRHISVHSE